VEEQLSCRHITKRLNATHTRTPTGKSSVWQTATVRNLLTNRVYAGQARDNSRPLVISQYRKTAAHRLRSLKTGRSYRAEREWVWSTAPALISAELFDKAQQQLQRHAATAHTRYQPASGRYVLRTLVTCGECGLSMVGIRRRGACHTYHDVYDQCSGHSARTVGRTTRCTAKLVRAERLDAIVWQALVQLLQTPSMIPHLHQTWATAQQQHLSGLEAQHAQLSQRQQRLERQDQRLLDADQTEVITLSELQARRQQLTAAWQRLEQERQQLAHTRQQRIHWQWVIENATTFRQLWGDHLDQLSCEERQAVAQGLINKVIVTGEKSTSIFFSLLNPSLRLLSVRTKSLKGHQGIFIGCVWHTSRCHVSPGLGHRRRR
jgi:Recombinase/Recombinase zinc beta ribbon domain